MPSDDQAGRSLGDSLRDVIAAALRGSPRNVAAAVNTSRGHHRVVAYSDQDVTVVERDGVTRVVHHRHEQEGTEADGS